MFKLYKVGNNSSPLHRYYLGSDNGKEDNRNLNDISRPVN